MKRTIIIFGSIAAAFLLLIRLSKYSLHSQSDNSEIYLSLAALLLIGIGLLISYLFRNPIQTKPTNNVSDTIQLSKVGLSKREQEILKLMAEGLSNAEIGSALFISISTVKTHVSNILIKLEAKRRTQAIQKARNLNLIP